MFIYPADKYEAEVLTDVFGPEAASVTFWDAEDGGFELAQAFDESGALIGAMDEEGDRWADLQEVASGRGQTVKFGIEIR